MTILESKSYLKIDQKINPILDRFLMILGPSWGPCGFPFGLWDATGTLPRRSKTLPRRSQDAPKTPKDAKKAPQEAPRGSHTPPSSILDDVSSIFFFCKHCREPLKVRSKIRCMLSCETLNLKIYVYTYTCIHMYIYRCMYINILPQGLLLPPTRCVV